MKSIELYTATVDNGGRRRDAGEKLTVGSDTRQIGADRARALIASRGAVDASPADKSKGEK